MQVFLPFEHPKGNLKNLLYLYQMQCSPVNINCFTDFGFKKLFGENASKDLLPDFLNVVLQEEVGYTPDPLTYPLFCDNIRGARLYEITNHLGNVMSVVNDRKIPVPKASPNEDEAEYFMPTVLMEMDYFPFGMQLYDPTTLTLDGEYRFGFGGQEKTDELKGEGNHYTAEFWEYDPRLGRRWNMDPVIAPWESPYAAFRNNPIYFIDPSGAEPEEHDTDPPPDMTPEELGLDPRNTLPTGYAVDHRVPPPDITSKQDNLKSRDLSENLPQNQKNRISLLSSIIGQGWEIFSYGGSGEFPNTTAQDGATKAFVSSMVIPAIAFQGAFNRVKTFNTIRQLQKVGILDNGKIVLSLTAAGDVLVQIERTSLENHDVPEVVYTLNQNLTNRAMLASSNPGDTVNMLFFRGFSNDSTSLDTLRVILTGSGFGDYKFP